MARKRKASAGSSYMGRSKRAVNISPRKILDPGSAEAKAEKNIKAARSAKREGKPVTAKALRQSKKRKTLIAYFSWSGTTRRVAEKLKKRLGADLLEITVDREYSKTYALCVLQAKKDALLGKTIKLTSKTPKTGVYDVLLLGFPVWWFGEPVAVDKFLEAFDTSGMTVYPFATSKSSKVDVALKKLAGLCRNAELGVACTANSEAAIDDWLKKTGLESE